MKISLITPRHNTEDSDTENDSETELTSDTNGESAPHPRAAEDPFGQNFHRMFDSFFSGKHPFFCPEGRAWNPPTDVYETEDALHIKIEVAGIREKDIDVKVNKDYLVIQGQRSDDKREGNSRYHLMEIHYGTFERVIRLPHTVEIDSISATLQNGFLMIRVPKDSTVVDYRIIIE